MGAHVSVPMYHRSLGQRLRLEGARCTACGGVSFPPRARCRSCDAAGGLETTVLSGRGVLHAVTWIAALGAPPEFASYAAVHDGFHVGIVELEEGPRITGMLVDTVAPAVGDPVRAVVRRLYAQEGVVRYGFKFAPAHGE